MTDQQLEAQRHTEQDVIGICFANPNRDWAQRFFAEPDLFAYEYHQDLLAKLKNERLEDLTETDLDYLSKCLDAAVRQDNGRMQYLYSYLARQRNHRKIAAYAAAVDNGEMSVTEFKTAIQNNIDISAVGKYEPDSLEDLKAAVRSTGQNLQLSGRFETLQSDVELKEGTAIVIGAGTGTGKSGMALNIFEELSKVYPCFYINIEMLKSEVFKRLYGISKNRRINTLNSENSAAMEDLDAFLAEFVADRNSSGIIEGISTPAQLREFLQTVRNVIPEERHICVFIDHIGIMQTGHKTTGIFEKTTEIMLELRSMTKEFNATMFVLAQINREGSKADRPLLLVDLKGSGELEQSAHCVWLLESAETDKPDYRDLYLSVAKNRSGRLGKYKYCYDVSTQRMTYAGYDDRETPQKSKRQKPIY
jgi:replicative DNA helicase